MPVPVIDQPPSFEAQLTVAASPVWKPTARSHRDRPLLSRLSSYGVSRTRRRSSSSTWSCGTFVPASRRISRATPSSRPPPDLLLHHGLLRPPALRCIRD